MESLSICSLASVYQNSAVIMAIRLSMYTEGVTHIQNDAIMTSVSNAVNLCHHFVCGKIQMLFVPWLGLLME